MNVENICKFKSYIKELFSLEFKQDIIYDLSNSNSLVERLTISISEGYIGASLKEPSMNNYNKIREVVTCLLVDAIMNNKDNIPQNERTDLIKFVLEQIIREQNVHSENLLFDPSYDCDESMIKFNL